MVARAELTGLRFGRLLVVGMGGIKRGAAARVLWECKCDCGARHFATTNNLRSGYCKSCGCLQRERATEHSLRHGKAFTRTHRIWSCMRQRCQNKNSNVYRHYGHRGIAVCERWQNFENFLADMGECPPGYSIERINNDGNYCPENCKWIPRSQQSLNTRKSVFVEYQGRRQLVSQWEAWAGVNRGVISYRLKAGWPVERAISNPCRTKKVTA